MKEKTLGEIAEFIQGELSGDPKLIISGINGLREARTGELSFVGNSKYEGVAARTKASAIIVSEQMNIPGKSVIRVKNPSLAFGRIADAFLKDEECFPRGIHKDAFIAPDVSMGKNVTVGPYAIIEKGVKIGDNTVIFGGAYIAHHSVVGDNCLIYPNVSIRERTEIGNQVILHCGVVLGADGFGFEKIDGVHQKIPQIGIVVVEDNVEIGANTTIDRARFDKTVIGHGTKIDNLVHIAHNVVVQENCIIIAQVGISGSSKLGKDVILAGQVGVVGRITLGDGVIVTSKSGVMKSVPAHTMVWGNPAKPHMKSKKVNACVQRLPKTVEHIKELEQRIKELEDQVKQK